MMLEQAQRHEGLGFNEKRSSPELKRCWRTTSWMGSQFVTVQDSAQLDLKPLVIVDTNLLVDALVQRAASEVGVASIVALDSGTQNGFHAAFEVLLEGKPDPSACPRCRPARGPWIHSKCSDGEILLGLPVPQSVIENVQRDLATLMDEVLDDFQTWVPPYPETREHASSRVRGDRVVPHLPC